MNSTPPVRARRGRPPKSESGRWQGQFLDHCIACFAASGYRNVSVDDIALSFGASKSTIYLHYGSKAGLVRAAIAHAMPKLDKPLMAISCDFSRDPRFVLYDFGMVIQAHTHNPGVRALWRAVSEARDDLNNDLHIIQEVTRTALLPLTTYLTELKSRSLIDTSDEAAAARFFSEIVSGGLVSFLGEPIPQAERRQALDIALEFFCKGIGLQSRSDGGRQN